jgi:DNA-binding NarL/FixJ family response regulator
LDLPFIPDLRASSTRRLVEHQLSPRRDSRLARPMPKRNGNPKPNPPGPVVGDHGCGVDLVAETITLVLGSVGPIYDRGLVSLLVEQGDFRIAAEGLQLGELEAAVAQYSPRVAILSQRHLVESRVLRRLGEISPGIGLIVLAGDQFAGTHWGAQLLALGATCLPEHVSHTDLLAAVRCAANGTRIWMPAGMATGQTALAAMSLTPREAEVFEHVQHGRTNRQIAQQLGITPETVSTHIKRIRRKLGISRRRDLAITV